MIDKSIYEKYDKIADTRFQGSGKTWDAIIHCANKNKFVIVLSNNRWEEIISGDLTLSLQVKTSKKQNWETLKRYNIFMFDDLFTKQDSIIARLLE